MFDIFIDFMLGPPASTSSMGSGNLTACDGSSKNKRKRFANRVSKITFEVVHILDAQVVLSHTFRCLFLSRSWILVQF